MEKNREEEKEGIQTVNSGSGFHKKKEGRSGESENDGKKSKEWRKHSEKLRFTYQEQKEFEVIDDEIASLEEKIAELEKQMQAAATDFVRLNECMKEKEEAEQLLEEKTERWVYLNELAEKIEMQKQNKS